MLTSTGTMHVTFFAHLKRMRVKNGVVYQFLALPHCYVFVQSLQSLEYKLQSHVKDYYKDM